MVVGMRKTSNATSTVTVIGLPCPAAAMLYLENDRSVAQATRNTIVIAATKVFKAILFSVFRRFAPSTSETMRSRNVSQVCGDSDEIDPSSSSRTCDVLLQIRGSSAAGIAGHLTRRSRRDD